MKQIRYGALSFANPKLLFMLILFAVAVSGMWAQTAVAPALGDGSEANPYQIATLQNLYWITQNDWALNQNYIQTADIDAWECRNWTPDIYGTIGWPGIGSGNRNRSFYGVYDGQGHVVDNIYIRNTPYGAGLFGLTSDLSVGAPGPVTIRNLGVTNVDIVGTNYVGALVGKGDYCNIINCWSTGTISTVPSQTYPPWQNPLTYKDYVGGLAGYRVGYGSISNSYSTCNVTNGSPTDGGNYTGGLVGFCGSIYNSYATGNVTGKNIVGGLVGEVFREMNGCYATGNVNGNDHIGGLSGNVNCGNGINNCYATGNVTGNAHVGGLASEIMFTDANRCYSTGFVTGTSRYGGLVGWINPDYLNWTHTYNCFWDVESSGMPTSAAGTGKTTAQMKTMSTFTSATWGFLGYNGTTWGMNPAHNEGYPFLAIQAIDQPCSVTTQTLVGIGSTTATGRGTVTNFGRPAISQRGFCWSTSPEPDLSDSFCEIGGTGALGAFTATLSPLLPYTTYYVKAYATNSGLTAYGDQTVFTTAPQLATLSTGAATSITTTSAALSGNVSDLGMPSPTQYGICWSTSPNPTIASFKTELGALSAAGEFTSNVSGLSIYTHYYYKAYATNLAGTAYGTQAEFTTLPTPTTVTTQAVSGIQATHAVGNGNINVLGIPNPYEYGVCWSTAQNPTIESSRSVLLNATQTGAYTSAITGLQPQTQYYVRAYVKTTAETSYGSQVNFTTAALDGTGTHADPYLISTLANLAYIQNNSFWNQPKFFLQTADIDATPTSTWNGGTGWMPIWYFCGNYNGQNHSISNLYINRAESSYQALWGDTRNNAVIRNLRLIAVNITGGTNVAPLVAYGNSTTISNCSSTGTINGYDSAGGIAGTSHTNNISYCNSSCTITGRSGGWSAGGISGYGYLTQINNCYFTGTLAGDTKVGGIAGYYIESSITNCYSAASVTAVSQGGGLVGSKYTSSITNSFWDLDTSNQSTSQGGTGKHTYEMQTKTTYLNTGWDFKAESANGTAEIWNIGNSRNGGYPYLNWQYSSDPADNPAALSTAAAGNVNHSSATANGTVWYIGNAIQHGFCWNTTGNPTISDPKTTRGALSLGTFSSPINGLTQLTTYYLRAYSTTALGTTYGNQISFNTPERTLEVSTQACTDITPTSASGQATIVTLGNSLTTQHGHCWSTVSPPTILNSKTELGSTETLGSFTSNLTELSAYTRYYVRAYAVNSQDTYYGEIVEFTTDSVSPVVSIVSVTDVIDVSSTATGTLDILGAPDPVQHGFCWNTSGNPTIADAKIELGTPTATGAYSSELSGLMPYTHYYVKAYATTTLETVYSATELDFVTEPGLATVNTLPTSNIGTYSATANASITALGAPNPTQHGFCWSTSPDPMIGRATSGEVFICELGTVTEPGAFSYEVTNLSSFTTYYIRAYATNPAGTSYGDVLSFRTLPVPAVVTTGEASELTANTAIVHGIIEDLGSPTPDQHGFCWSTTEQPSLSDSITELGAVTETGAFSSNLTGLASSTTYYVKAYASTAGTTVYGNQMQFATTPLPTQATLSTQAVTAISGASATANGTITSLGYPNPTEYGFCWSTNHSPTIANSTAHLSDATQTGSYSIVLNGLSPATSYFLRAYASNTSGTAYGNEVSFTTAVFIGLGTLENPYQIRSLSDLQILSSDDSYSPIYSNKHFIQTADINAASSSSWNSNTGFKPICDYYYSPFSGSYNGQNHTIDGLTISRSGSVWQGMFGFTSGANISNLNLTNVSITSGGNCGGVIGRAEGGTINYCKVTGSISGGQSTAGIAGLTYGTAINYCVNKSSISGNGNTGGLVGSCYDNSQIKFCYNEGAVVSAGSYSGGLIGYLTNSNIQNCYNRGSIQGGAETGGLVGRFQQSYIIYCYSTGLVSGSSCGGLLGLYYYDDFKNCYWDTTTSMQTASNSGSMTYGISNVAGFSTSLMKQQSSYLNWDFSSIWGISPRINNGYPYLLNQYELLALDSPVPVISFNAAANTVGITWNAVVSAASYRIYASETPDAPFPSNWTQVAVVSAMQDRSYTPLSSSTRMFYRIVASTEAP